MIDLGTNDDELTSCVACGLCLPHCPTYRVTGEEALSPRGRIAAMRQVQWEGAPVDAAFVRSMETCVQCRGCETACPSGVPFGHLMEATRETLATGLRAAAPEPRGTGQATGTPTGAAHAPDDRATAGAPGRSDASVTPLPRTAALPPPARPPAGLRLGLRMLGHRRLLLAASSLLGLAQRLRVVPRSLSRRFGLPDRLPVRRPALRASGTDVWLFTGCVMDAWMREVHVDVVRVVEATGAGVSPAPSGAACCGALAQHAGLGNEARRLAQRTVEAFVRPGPGPVASGDAPILVDAAGCGAMLGEAARMLGTGEAAAVAARTLDVHQWLADRVDRLPAPDPDAPRPRVAVQDPCHLRHVQRSHGAVRAVLERYADVVELDDDGLCCGAGGAYALVQPELAAAVRDRKVAAIRRTGARVVASANPGCMLHLASALATHGIEVAHPCQIVARALPG